MSIEGHRQGHFLTLFFPGFVYFVLYEAQISGERLQDLWASGLFYHAHAKYCVMGTSTANFERLFLD